MKLAHIADPHLGIRQYHRQTSSGINQREADLAQAFRAAIDGVIAARPDAVVVAGDLFHSVRPTNYAIVFAFRQFQRLREALPNAPIILIAGNHDTPRTIETGSILRSVRGARCGCGHRRASPAGLSELDLSVFAVPRQASLSPEPPALESEHSQKYQVLVAHFEVEGEYPLGQSRPTTAARSSAARELHLEDWTYVALGHYHTQHRVAANAWYAGSLDYIGPNIWGEAGRRSRPRVPWKGLAARRSRHRRGRAPAGTGRAKVLDLEPIKAEGKSAEAVDELIAERVALHSGRHRQSDRPAAGVRYPPACRARS